MRIAGLKKAKDDLHAAKKATDALRGAANLDVAEESWITFVEKFGRFFNKLAASAKGDAKSEAWISRLNQRRSKDEMLNYLLQARNCAEHSVDDLTKKENGHFSISGSSIYIESLTIDRGKINGRVFGSPDTQIINRPPRLTLVSILNRGVSYEVPSSHGGRTIDPTPIEVATLAIQFGEEILSEAEAIAQKKT